jgi:hypothetical protein
MPTGVLARAGAYTRKRPYTGGGDTYGVTVTAVAGAGTSRVHQGDGTVTGQHGALGLVRRRGTKDDPASAKTVSILARKWAMADNWTLAKTADATVGQVHGRTGRYHDQWTAGQVLFWTSAATTGDIGLDYDDVRSGAMMQDRGILDGISLPCAEAGTPTTVVTAAQVNELLRIRDSALLRDGLDLKKFAAELKSIEHSFTQFNQSKTANATSVSTSAPPASPAKSAVSAELAWAEWRNTLDIFDRNYRAFIATAEEASKLPAYAKKFGFTNNTKALLESLSKGDTWYDITKLVPVVVDAADMQSGASLSAIDPSTLATAEGAVKTAEQFVLRGDVLGLAGDLMVLLHFEYRGGIPTDTLYEVAMALRHGVSEDIRDATAALQWAVVELQRVRVVESPKMRDADAVRSRLATVASALNAAVIRVRSGTAQQPLPTIPQLQCSRDQPSGWYGCGAVPAVRDRQHRFRIVGVVTATDAVSRDACTVEVAVCGHATTLNYWGSGLQPGTNVGFVIKRTQRPGRTQPDLMTTMYPWKSDDRRSPSTKDLTGDDQKEGTFFYAGVVVDPTPRGPAQWSYGKAADPAGMAKPADPDMRPLGFYPTTPGGAVEFDLPRAIADYRGQWNTVVIDVGAARRR